MQRPPLDDGGLLRALRAEFSAAGFDIFATFPAGAYNAHDKIAPRPELLIPAKDESTLAIIVGNTRELWEPFCRHLKSSLEGAALLASTDPLDQYTKHIVQRVLSQVSPGEETEVVYAFETVEENGRCCSVHTAGHVAGLAYYDAAHTQRSIHPIYGPWFAYRAVITLPGRVWSKALPGTAEAPCSCPCSEEELRKVAALQASVMAEWGKVSEQESWNGLIRVSEAFVTGAEHKYSDAQLHYHYSPQEADRARVLRECTA
jgi:hypothetical protein